MRGVLLDVERGHDAGRHPVIWVLTSHSKGRWMLAYTYCKPGSPKGIVSSIFLCSCQRCCGATVWPVRPARFIIVGLLNTAVDLGAFDIPLSLIPGMPLVVANTLSKISASATALCGTSIGPSARSSRRAWRVRSLLRREHTAAGGQHRRLHAAGAVDRLRLALGVSGQGFRCCCNLSWPGTSWAVVIWAFRHTALKGEHS